MSTNETSNASSPHGNGKRIKRKTIHFSPEESSSRKQGKRQRTEERPKPPTYDKGV